MVTSPEAAFAAEPPMKFVLLEVSLRRTWPEPPSRVIFPPAANMSVQLSEIEFEPAPELGEPTREISAPPVAEMVVLAAAAPAQETIPRPLVDVPVERPVMLIAVPEDLADVMLVLYEPPEFSSMPCPLFEPDGATEIASRTIEPAPEFIVVPE